ncbi:MAG TPA: type II toxin-antitoxin system RelE/ParE family toxin [Thermoanaerobaculia bacterium]|nr:type II toxin-antitoxin system RelE/ParE family toxin [Thermoanaerobaculia bacterium]
MWNDRLRLAAGVEGDWLSLSLDERAIARASLEAIDEDPIAGAPLFEPLRGLWSYRAGNLRVLYRIAPEAQRVMILMIGRVTELES